MFWVWTVLTLNGVLGGGGAYPSYYPRLACRNKQLVKLTPVSPPLTGAPTLAGRNLLDQVDSQNSRPLKSSHTLQEVVISLKHFLF